MRTTFIKLTNMDSHVQNRAPEQFPKKSFVSASHAFYTHFYTSFLHIFTYLIKEKKIIEILYVILYIFNN